MIKSFSTPNKIFWLLAASALLALLLAACQSPRHVDSNTRVNTRSGPVAGFAHSEGVVAWLGIPYAAPPINELRWRAPAKPASWQDLRPAMEFGQPCVQLPNFTIQEKPRAPRITVGQEDCLTLNVFAPRAVLESKQPLPVMFWIHGGGNTSGASLSYNGGPLASGQQVVLVTFNYRLGLFGYFRHPGLRDAQTSLAEQSGNFGILDIIAGLQWVQDNITAFGGDKNNVTVFGESAGGKNTWALVQTHLATGLFHKAIVQSGSLRLMDPDKSESISPNAPDYKVYRNNTSEVLDRVLPGASAMREEAVASALRAKSADEMYVGIKLNDAGSHRQPRLFLDGFMFKQPALDLLAQPGNYNSVPIITGANRDEDKLFMQYNPKWVKKRFGLIRTLRDPERYDLAARYASDYWRVLTVDEPARVISASDGAPVYAYRFDFDNHLRWPINLVDLVGAAHALEIPFVFGTHEEAPWSKIFRARKERAVLSDIMMDYWGGFAHNGKPGRGRSGTQPEWKQWRSGAEQLMMFDIYSDGGVRMSESPLRVAEIKHRLAVDDSLSASEKCKAYSDLFLNGYQTPDYYSEAEFLNFAGANCAL
ncbi:MAG: carboxylesterase family protein [Pseudomonadales bacterium]|nr:carboxylesterase family protein [Pseudomonadales bacterium]